MDRQTLTPCIGVCTLEDDICIGCNRTIEEINIEPKVRERNVQIEKLKTPRKPKSTMIIKTVTKSSKSGSMTLQIPKSVKSNMRGGGSSVNSTIKALQELAENLRVLSTKYPGSIIETKPTGVAAHYRRLPKTTTDDY